MGLLTRVLLGERRERAHPANAAAAALWGSGGWQSAAGIEVSETSALTNTAVLGAVRVLSESVAMLPLIVYERQEGGGKRRAVGHPLYRLLHDAPNPEQTAMEFREISIVHLLLWGNFYAEIEIDGAGRVRALWPLRPDRMRIARVNGELVYYYRVRAGEGEVALGVDRVLHIPGMGYDGVAGQSLIGLARNAVGLGLATEEFGSRFFMNGARPGMVLQHPGTLGDQAYERVKSSWESRHQGLSNAHRVAILEEGMTVKEVGIPPQDAQYLETRRFQATEIARVFRVPPHMLADLERATFSNIEHQGLEFVMFSLSPWLVRWEQRVRLRLLLASERERIFAEHLVDGLLRGDTGSRFAAYAVGRQWGWLSANDVRALENMNPVAGGDVYLSPLNMVASDDGEEGEREGEGRSVEKRGRGVELRAAKGRRGLGRSYRRTVEGALRRVVNREANDVRNAARRLLGAGDVAGFREWMREFYQEHRQFCLRYLGPVFATLGELAAQGAAEEIGQEMPKWDGDAVASDYLAVRVDGWMWEHERALEGVLERGAADGNVDMAAEAETVTEAWRGDEVGAVAEEQTNTFVNYAVRAAFVLLGVQVLRWSASGGEDCPYCREMDGRTIEISRSFLEPGGVLGVGADQVFRTQRIVSHPPLHAGCDCVVVAG